MFKGREWRKEHRLFFSKRLVKKWETYMFIRMNLKIFEGEAPRNGLYISALKSKEMGDHFLGRERGVPRHFCLPLEFYSGLSRISGQLQEKMLF